jgi:uncharacterized membrane protein
MFARPMTAEPILGTLARRDRNRTHVPALFCGGDAQPLPPGSDGRRKRTLGDRSMLPQRIPVHLVNLWERLRTNFWLVPSGMVAVAIALSFLLIEIDVSGEGFISEAGFLYTFGPEGARAILSAIAGSMITVAGLTFSLKMLTLQLAASQFGPRMLRNFMRDRGNQVVLGIFIATFVYCLMVLRTVRGTEESSFVPHLAVAFGVLMALVSLAVLIYFIHHVASAIRIETLLRELADEVSASIDQCYPDNRDADADAGAAGASTDLPDSKLEPAAGGQWLGAPRTGYVQAIDLRALVDAGKRIGILLRIDASIGDFVIEGSPLLAVSGGEELSKEDAERIAQAFVISSERTPDQDIGFSLRRIVEIAQRVLSPGINDPTTAVYCIDRLGEALSQLAQRKVPSSRHCDDQGKLRVVAGVTSFAGLACPTLAAIARYGMKDPDVIGHLLQTMQALARQAPPADRAEIELLAQAIRETAREELSMADRMLVRNSDVWSCEQGSGCKAGEAQR